jgi:hypothetical protein
MKKIVLLLTVLFVAPVAAESVFGIDKPGGGELLLYPKRPCLLPTLAPRERIGRTSIEYHTVSRNIIHGCYRMERSKAVAGVIWEDGDTGLIQLNAVYRKQL